MDQLDLYAELIPFWQSRKAKDFADIAEALGKSANADKRTAFTRQVGDCLEIYSVPDAKEAK